MSQAKPIPNNWRRSAYEWQRLHKGNYHHQQLVATRFNYFTSTPTQLRRMRKKARKNNDSSLNHLVPTFKIG